MPDINQYCLEANRLISFTSKWPHADDSICSKEAMAKAGFFYVGYGDCVRCFVCHLKLEEWDPDEDEPRSKHIEMSPNCLFAVHAKEEAQLTVDQWIDIMCNRTLNLFDNKFSRLVEDIEKS